MTYRLTSTEVTGEFRLAQLAAERHPEANLPYLPEAYCVRYPHHLPYRAESAAEPGSKAAGR